MSLTSSLTARRDRRRRLAALLGAPLAALQLLALTAAPLLHTHDVRELALAGLPAEYHVHDYGLAAGADLLPLPPDDCLGCRLERSPSAPARPAAAFATALGPAATPPAPAPAAVRPALFPAPRAPPAA